jgi:membrane protein required for colicin V production
MNYIDMFILVLLIYAVYRGFTRGFILQLTILAALALGIFAALKLSYFTAEKLKDHLSVSQESLQMIAIAVTFALVFVGVRIIGNIVEKLVEAVDLSVLNRMFGVLFSVGKIVIICGVLLLFVDRLDKRFKFLPENSRERSMFYEPFTKITTMLFPSLHKPGSDYEGIKVQA